MRGWLQLVRAAAARHRFATDAAAAAVIAALGVLSAQVVALRAQQGPDLVVVTVLTLALILPLAWRRSHPLTVLLIMTVLFFPYEAAGIGEETMSVIALWIALYSAGAYGERRWRDWVRGVTVAAVLGYASYYVLFTDWAVERGGEAAFWVGAHELLLDVFLLAAAWVFGNTMAARRAAEADLRERAAQAERDREDKARRAIFAERVRIARELHDVVAHHVSVMGVQAGAARRVMDAQPERARDALSAIEVSCRQAVAELHRLLGFLRQEGETDVLAPQPNLGSLDLLVGQLSEAKLSIAVVVEGHSRPLPPGVDLSAYRVVQESLTNTLKHASATRATVTVRYHPSALEVEVLDDGVGTAGVSQRPGGHGLIGMRERVSLQGGHLRIGPCPSGGFAVRATFPTDGSRS